MLKQFVPRYVKTKLKSASAGTGRAKTAAATWWQRPPSTRNSDRWPRR